MKVIKPKSVDQTPSGVCVFLAGSIEMGAAEEWQAVVEDNLSDLDVTFFNPRRDNWDSSWEQRESNPEFNYQVTWEMDNLENVDVIFMYLSPGTKSPISLLELGLHASDEKLIVCCPDGFWRKGNVEILCRRFDIPMYNSLEEAIAELRKNVQCIC